MRILPLLFCVCNLTIRFTSISFKHLSILDSICSLKSAERNTHILESNFFDLLKVFTEGDYLYSENVPFSLLIMKSGKGVQFRWLYQEASISGEGTSIKISKYLSISFGNSYRFNIYYVINELQKSYFLWAKNKMYKNEKV